MKKKALILGATGQDGSYMIDLLLSKKYQVHGVYRKSSVGNTQNIDHLIRDKYFKQTCSTLWAFSRSWRCRNKFMGLK